VLLNRHAIFWLLLLLDNFQRHATNMFKSQISWYWICLGYLWFYFRCAFSSKYTFSMNIRKILFEWNQYHTFVQRYLNSYLMSVKEMNTSSSFPPNQCLGSGFVGSARFSLPRSRSAKMCGSTDPDPWCKISTRNWKKKLFTL